MTGPVTPAPPTDPVVESLLRWRANVSKAVGLVVFGLLVLWFVLGPDSTTTLLSIGLVLMVLLLLGQIAVKLVVRSRQRRDGRTGDIGTD